MIQRCTDPNCKAYRYYGARGITVHPKWRYNFVAFLEHVGPRPSKLHQIDRINSDMGYEPGNVRWSTRTQQSNNRSNTVWIEHAGERLPLAEWARRLGAQVQTLWARLAAGWAHSKIVTVPVESTPVRKQLTYRGRTKSVSEWAKISGLSADTIAMRIKRGWSTKDALETPLLRRRR